MSAIRHADREVDVGVDAGGTWLRVLAVDGGGPAAVIRLPAAGVRELGKSLRRVWRQRAWDRRRVGGLVVASRGIWTPRERRRLARDLTSLARRVVVLSDAQAALLGAIGDRPGLLVLSGTGSIVVGLDGRGRWARAGGLGPLLGDEGSGFWIGREWLRATTRGEDMEPVRGLVRAPDAVARIAALAPDVLGRARRGDRRARAVVARAQDHLAALTVDVARQLRLPRPVTVSWAGSVLGDERFRAGLRRAVARAGLRCRWQPPAAPAVVAAARLARRIAAR